LSSNVLSSGAGFTEARLGDVSDWVSGCAHNASPQRQQKRSDPDSCSVDEEAEKEPMQKVELKGDDKTDILFSGKTTFRTKLTDAANPWTPATAGALTVRKDKASGAAWLQVNNESKVCPPNSIPLHVLCGETCTYLLCACSNPVFKRDIELPPFWLPIVGLEACDRITTHIFFNPGIATAFSKISGVVWKKLSRAGSSQCLCTPSCR
jgi:hypothetical protein